MAEVVQESKLSETLGRRVRELRQARQMSQVELAGVLGVDQSLISRVESRRGANFNLAVLEQLAWALDVELVIELRPKVAS